MTGECSYALSYNERCIRTMGNLGAAQDNLLLPGAYTRMAASPLTGHLYSQMPPSCSGWPPRATATCGYSTCATAVGALVCCAVVVGEGSMPVGVG